MNTIHFHIGVDKVAVSAVSRIFNQGFMDNLNLDGRLITTKEYSNHFMSTVNMSTISASQVADVENIFVTLGINSSVIVFSRPNLLFSGGLMNTYSSQEKSLYKIETIQQLFCSHKLVFHLFIIDHVSYLAKHEKSLLKLQSPSRYSWVPFIEAIRRKISGKNKLLVWNGEQPTVLKARLLEHIFSMQPEDAQFASANYLSAHSKTPNLGIETKHLFDERYEEQLDLQFEKDLHYMSEIRE